MTREPLGRVFEGSPIAMAAVAGDGRLVETNASFRALLGASAAQPDAHLAACCALSHLDRFGVWFDAARRPGPQAAPEHFPLRRDGGGVAWGAFSLSPLGPAAGGDDLLVTVVEVTQLEQLRTEVALERGRDPLTGLLDRAAMEVALEDLGRARRSKDQASVVLLRIVGLDHLAAPEASTRRAAALTAVAGVLLGRLRATDLVARWAEEEFLVVLHQVTPEQATFVAKVLVQDIRNQVLVPASDSLRQLSASAGVQAIEPGSSADEVLAQARAALEAALARGGAMVWKGPGGQTHLHRDHDVIDFDHFVLLAQPIVELSSGAVTRYEMLARGRDDAGELVAAAHFIPLAERLGQVGRIDRWVIRHTIATIAADPRPEISYHLNVSGRSLSDPHLMVFIGAELTASGINPARLVFELTEAAAMFDLPFAAAFARYLTMTGCKFAIDQVGLDPGGLHALTALPFDFLKIDGAFVRRCRSSTADRLVIEAIVAIATGLSKKTIACAVEELEELEILRTLGVDLAQGYLLGRPSEPVAIA